jgi:hypothetical protein
VLNLGHILLALLKVELVAVITQMDLSLPLLPINLIHKRALTKVSLSANWLGILTLLVLLELSRTQLLSKLFYPFLLSTNFGNPTFTRKQIKLLLLQQVLFK